MRHATHLSRPDVGDALARTRRHPRRPARDPTPPKPAFDPSKFEDEADEALRAAIAAHARQPERKVAASGNGKRAQPDKLSDLVASLRASQEGGHRTRRVARTAAKKPRKRAKRTASSRA